MEDLFENYIDTRPPRLCKQCGKCNDKFPSSPFEEIPEGCGYEGWIFLKREEEKKQVRKQKELLLSLEIKLKTASNKDALQLIKRIEKIKKSIEVYLKYGAKDW